METLNRQGIRRDLTSRHVVGKSVDSTSRQVGEKFQKRNLTHDVSNYSSYAIAGSEVGESRENIRRYVSLTRLLPPLLDMVDNEAMPLMAGVAVSFLSSAAQETLLRVLRVEGITSINRSQGEALKEIRDRLDGVSIIKIRKRGVE